MSDKYPGGADGADGVPAAPAPVQVSGESPGSGAPGTVVLQPYAAFDDMGRRNPTVRVTYPGGLPEDPAPDGAQPQPPVPGGESGRSAADAPGEESTRVLRQPWHYPSSQRAESGAAAAAKANGHDPGEGVWVRSGSQGDSGVRHPDGVRPPVSGSGDTLVSGGGTADDEQGDGTLGTQPQPGAAVGPTPADSIGSGTTQSGTSGSPPRAGGRVAASSPPSVPSGGGGSQGGSGASGSHRTAPPVPPQAGPGRTAPSGSHHDQTSPTHPPRHRRGQPPVEPIDVPLNLEQYAVLHDMDYLSPNFADQLSLSPPVSRAAEALAAANRALTTYHGDKTKEIERLRAAIRDRTADLDNALARSLREDRSRRTQGDNPGEFLADATHMTATALIYSAACEVRATDAGTRDRILAGAETVGRVMSSRTVTGLRRAWKVGGLTVGVASGGIPKMVVGAVTGAILAPVIAFGVRRGMGRLQARAERHQQYNTEAGMSARATALLTAIRMPGRGETSAALLSNARRVMDVQGTTAAAANHQRRVDLVHERSHVGARRVWRDIGMGAINGAASAGMISGAMNWDTLTHNLSHIMHGGDLVAQAAAIDPAQAQAIVAHYANADPSQLDGIFGEGHRVVTIQSLAHQDFGSIADPGAHHGYASTGMDGASGGYVSADGTPDLGSEHPMGDIREAIDKLNPYEDQGLVSVQEYTTANGSTAFRLEVPQDIVITVPGADGTATSIFVPAGGVDGLGYYPGVYQSEIYEAMLHGGNITSVQDAISQMQVDPQWVADHIDVIRAIPGMDGFTLPSGDAAGRFDDLITGLNLNNVGGTVAAGVAGGVLGAAGGSVIRNPRYAAPNAPNGGGSTLVTPQGRPGSRRTRYRYPTVAQAGNPALGRQRGEISRDLAWPNRNARYGRGMNAYISNPDTRAFFRSLEPFQQGMFVQNLANATGRNYDQIMQMLSQNDNDEDEQDSRGARSAPASRP